jgi:hypothetical protein
MTQTLTNRPATRDAAARLAGSNYAANRAALAVVQPELVTESDSGPEAAEWVLARDGSLTAMAAGGQWWGNCSLPVRAAEYMFKALEIRGVVGCFLFPVHAGQLRAALNRLEPHQAVLVLVPDRLALRVMLHCDDFSAEIRKHRLWFAAGEDWQKGLAELFVGQPGLPTPGDFIRAISDDSSAADALIAPAQKIFADVTTRRALEIEAIASSATSTPKGARAAVCVIAPSHFRLWNDAPKILADVLGAGGEFDCRLFDSDDPASASPLALAKAVAGAEAVITANLARADLPAVIPAGTPVVTWVTMPRIAEYNPSAESDALIVADPAWGERARAMGWPGERIHVGTWPTAGNAGEDREKGAVAALIADTASIVPPKSVNEFSSHLLLWDSIAAELRRDPSAVGSDVEAYLAARVKKFGIEPGAFQSGLFIEHLIVPAYQQSIARRLIAEGVPVRLYGKGWGEIEDFAPYAGGVVGTRARFEQIVAELGALVHAWPVGYVHPVEAAGLAVIRPGHLAGRREDERMPVLSPAIIRAASV